MIPIDKAVNDPFYRYKMPEITINYEGNKTVLSNIDQVSKSLSRNPSHILKFLAINFGCTSSLGNEKFALNGNFDIVRIQNGIYSFIEEFVLCQHCRNPETRFTTEDEIGGLLRLCNSCGKYSRTVHKLNSQILKDKNINEDTKYELNNKTNINALIKEDESEMKIYETFKQEGFKLEDLSFRSKDLKKIALVLKDYSIKDVLECIEDMLEKTKKEDKMEGYLNGLVKIGFDKEVIDEYISKPREGKKRGALIKKIYESFADEDYVPPI